MAVAVELDQPRIVVPLAGAAERAEGTAHDVDVVVRVGGNAFRIINLARSGLPAPKLMAVAVKLYQPRVEEPLAGAAERAVGFAHDVDVAVGVGRNAIPNIIDARSGLPAPQPMAVTV
jgi:hypothetical protein